MSLAVFAACLLAGLALVSLPPVVYAKKRASLFVSDLALFLVPAAAFTASFALLNARAQVGLAVLVYPFLCIAVCVVLLWVRVFLLGRLSVPQRAMSRFVLAVACVVAFVAGFAVPPLYE